MVISYLQRPPLLVLYHLRGTAQLPLRTAIVDHLQCWRRHSRFPVIYHNYAFGFNWADYAGLPLSGVILDTLALNLRWSPELFRARTRSLLALRQFSGPKIAMPQDEFIHTDVLCEFLAAIGVTDVLSAASRETAEQIYREALPNVRLGQKLTGYLEDETLYRIEQAAREIRHRDIDVSYRAWHAEAWLGEHGRLKVQVAQETMAASPGYPQLRFDVSTSESDVLTGDDWYRFLLRSRCALGVEGGASVLDRDGTIAARTRAYVAEHPGASFETVRAACFAEQEGTLALFAIGPRHLEACATRTCQLLIEGEYQGILRAGQDYIAINRDFSNLPDVLDRVARRDPALVAAADSAYQRVVASGDYTYRAFVRRVEADILLPRSGLFSRVLSPSTAWRIKRAVRRHQLIENFAMAEALEFLPHRYDYEHSQEPVWQAARERARKLADEEGLLIDPDWH